MNPTMIRHLILKDWAFNRSAIAAYSLGGILALVAMRYSEGVVFLMAGVVLAGILLGLGAHMAFLTVLSERSEKTLPFVMSLPITVNDYSVAKVLSNLIIFVIPWLCVLLTSLVVVYDSPGLPDGLVPLLMINMGLIFFGYILLVGTALITESTAWTVVGILACNLLLQLGVHLVPRMQAIGSHVGGQVPVWNTEAVLLLVAEIVAGLGVLCAVFWCQSRKRDFT